MDEKYANLCKKIESAEKTIGMFESIVDLQDKQHEYQSEVSYLESHKSHLEKETNSLEIEFQQLINNQHQKMVDIAFDGFMSSKMLNAASEWEYEHASQQHTDFIIKVNNVSAVEKTPEELIDYLCRTIQLVRPTYNRNTIINIAICMTQGFLTVFSGEPGCGKTSICNIFGTVLGLNKKSEYLNPYENTNRFVSVSVDKGWTSKRDLVGYYNPLSKTFDKNNSQVFDALHQLDTEKTMGFCKFPYYILLDEANLSPMEYYWSDFMNICDDLGPHSNINLGEKYVFSIPETLHFLATINNDDTTEILSPRLIDRAWTISLPQQYNTSITSKEIPAESIELITWTSLRKAFIPEDNECVLTSDIQKIYDAIVSKLKEKHFSVSHRIDNAIKRYWTTASKYFETDDTKTDAKTVALDYAISQRILPKITGNGMDFETWLNELRDLCGSNSLNMSTKILKDIIERGNQQMKYFKFFY